MTHTCTDAHTSTYIYTRTHTHTHTLYWHTQNVVVVGQPSAPPTTVVCRTQRRENDYMVFTLVLLVLCFLHGNILAVVLLIPALICSVTVSCQTFQDKIKINYWLWKFTIMTLYAKGILFWQQTLPCAILNYCATVMIMMILNSILFNTRWS